MRRYFLQCIDEDSGFVIEEVPCGSLPLPALRRIVNPCPGDPDIKDTYLLSPEQIDALKQLCQLRVLPRQSFGQVSCQMQLTSWDNDEGLSYRLHTCRELPLMLMGIKPLSLLYGTVPTTEGFVEIPEYLFDPYVEAGRFVKRDYCLLVGTSDLIRFRSIRYVLYALRHEAWRIDAFIVLQHTASKTGWNEALTRMEGTLLGYEEWQNDVFINQMNQSSDP
jgi:hypothetical protein